MKRKFDNILSINQKLASRLKLRRREAGLSQKHLAEKAAVSYGSLKRFEQHGEISLASFIKILIVLGYENDLNEILTRPNYQTLEDIFHEK